MRIFWSFAYVAAMIAVALVYQTGQLHVGDGVFLVASIMTIFTGHWLIASETAHEAPVASMRLLSAGSAYAVCLVLASVVTLQALSLT